MNPNRVIVIFKFSHPHRKLNVRMIIKFGLNYNKIKWDDSC